MLAQALKHAGAPRDMDDLPLSIKKVERIARHRSSQKRALYKLSTEEAIGTHITKNHTQQTRSLVERLASVEQQ